MFEKVNMDHPDKVADRIAGAIVDLAYQKESNPKIAVELLLGHGHCTIISESSVWLDEEDVFRAVHRITGKNSLEIEFIQMRQDKHLSENQKGKIRCGDNGIFCGKPVTEGQKKLTELARRIYEAFPYDGKYIIDGERVIICQSHAMNDELENFCPGAKINPLGPWTGGPDVDTGAVNRKLGSDMGDAVTGGGLHGKDLSKADVSVNIYAHLKAQETGRPVQISCAIGDEFVDGRPYSKIVEIARTYIQSLGGFEKFAQWGLIR